MTTTQAIGGAVWRDLGFSDTAQAFLRQNIHLPGPDVIIDDVYQASGQADGIARQFKDALSTSNTELEGLRKELAEIDAKIMKAESAVPRNQAAIARLKEQRSEINARITSASSINDELRTSIQYFTGEYNQFFELLFKISKIFNDAWMSSIRNMVA